MIDKTSLLKEIRNEVLHNESLPLYKFRKGNNYHPVIGQGNHNAKIVFIGEAPGENEAKTGLPFCGAAGRILDEILSSIEIERSNVYITNIVKDRPPKNRDPSQEEIDAYAPYLLRQLKIIQPDVIATLGRHSTSFMLKFLELPQNSLPISKLHGELIALEALQYAKYILPLYHPAVALYSPTQKTILLKDIKLLKRFLD